MNTQPLKLNKVRFSALTKSAKWQLWLKKACFFQVSIATKCKMMQILSRNNEGYMSIDIY